MLKFINFPLFLASFLIGILFVYISTPLNTKVNVYPTPNNYMNIDYVDKTGNCFILEPQEEDCVGKDNIKDIPVQY